MRAEGVLTLVLAVLVDLLLGEYPNAIHPVAHMGFFGKVIDKLTVRTLGASAHLRFSLGSLALTLEATLWALLALSLTNIPDPHLRVVIGSFALKSTFSIRSLYEHVRRCVTDDEAELRFNVSMIVSRDVRQLDRPHLHSAALESLSENISDAITGPLFFYTLFGLTGAMLYRVVNTYDALFGYRNERYEWFGKSAARADDFLNIVPSRLTAAFIAVFSPRRAFSYVTKYGGLKLNGTYPMSAFAGVLGVGFEKVGYYRFDGPLPDVDDLRRGLALYVRVAGLIVLFFVLSTWFMG